MFPFVVIGQIFCLHILGFFGASKLTKSFGFSMDGVWDGEMIGVYD